LDPGIEYVRSRLLAEAHLFGCPKGHFLDAVLDAQRALGPADLDVPPAAKAGRGVSPVAQQISGRAVYKLHVNARVGKDDLTCPLAKAGTAEKCLDMGD